jgi:glycosyltransferase involved in cell wall biosynthesis
MPDSGGALTLTIVVPAFNEQERIGATVHALSEYLSPRPWTWEIRVVDDGSSDGTASVVAGLAARDARVVLQREPHRGKGGAVKAGMLAAISQFRFLCDADLSMPAGELSRFLPPVLSGFDVAIGSREGVGARRVGEPLVRHVMGRVFNYAVQQAVLPGIEDTQCGFKMFTGRAADAIFPRVTVEGWAFDIEALYIARLLGLEVVEVPIEWHYRHESQVSMFRDSAGMLRELLRIRRRAARGEYQ